MLGQFSVICIFHVLERFHEVSVSLFQFDSCYSNVTLFLFVVSHHHISSVDYAFHEALSSQWACISVFAVACGLFVRCCLVLFYVLLLYKCFHVVHAAIPYLYRVAVENLV